MRAGDGSFINGGSGFRWGFQVAVLVASLLIAFALFALLAPGVLDLGTRGPPPQAMGSPLP